MSNQIRTIVRESERNGGRLTMKRYKADTKLQRGLSLSKKSMEQRHLFHMRNFKPKEQSQQERQQAIIKESKKNVSVWQKVKNFLRGKK